MSRITDDRSRVLVVCADGDTAAAVRGALQAAGDFVWCGWATDMASVRRLPPDLGADVVVTDVAVPGPGGGAVVSTLAAAFPRTPLVVWTLTLSPRPLLAALREGVFGYVNVDDGLDALVDALRAALAGRIALGDRALESACEALGRPASTAVPPLNRRTTRVIVESASLHAAASLTDSDTPLDAADVVEELTRRELQVLSKLGLGLDNRAIGSQLGLSVGTVTGYVRRIREKLGARTRGELITMSARLGESSAAAS